MHERCGMSTCANGVNCGVEWIKGNLLKWSGHFVRMGSEEFVKVYESEPEGPNRRGKPLGRWKDRVEENLGERGINPRTLTWGDFHPALIAET